MDEIRQRRLVELFDRALELSEDERERFFERLDGADRGLHSELRSLLDSHDQAPDFLEALADRLIPSALAAVVMADRAPAAESIPDRYEILRPVGGGGMGMVYEARDRRLGRTVALKFLSPYLTADERARRRLLAEARAASVLDHPNIAVIHEIEETDEGRPFISMAYYEGQTLREMLASGPLTPSEAVRLASQISAGLSAAHHAGIVHRDVKPSNILVTGGGVAKLLDFGIATAEAEDRPAERGVVGTVAYMSPEQTRGEIVDRRSDVWSTGVVLYEMLTGARPFRGDSREVVISAIQNAEPEPVRDRAPETLEALETVVRRCLRKDPDARYRTSEELGEELDRIRRGLSDADRDPGGKRARVGAAALVGVVVALTAMILVRGGSDASSGAPPAGSVGGESTSAILPRPARTIAVIPPATVGRDSVLDRLGRQLAVTLSANLNGMAGIRTIPPLSILARFGAESASLERGADVAKELGASGVLHGNVLRSGDVIRLDMRLYDAATLDPVAHAPAVGSPDDITALTDSTTVRLLRQIWKGRDAPVPNLAAATSASMPALRAYLEGELAYSRAEYRQAVTAFERAFEHDPGFLLAYWRSLGPRDYATSPPDGEVLDRIVEQRDRLPDPDRLMVEAETAESLTARLASLREVTTRFSGYWPAWYAYADQLVHAGSYLGRTHDDARIALERLVSLNPHFAAGWQHLLWIAFLQRDAAAADRALEALKAFESTDAFMFNPGNMAYFRAVRRLLTSNGVFSEEETTELARIALRVSPRLRPEAIAISTLDYGFPRAQIQQSDALLRQGATREVIAGQWMGRTHSWAARGAWDSALVAAGEWIGASHDPGTQLRAYGLSVLGAVLGAITPEEALGMRPDPATEAPARDVDARAELAWLDGVIAFVGGDPEAIAESGNRLAESEAEFGEILHRSLEAFGAHAAGRRHAAARQLAALEWRVAEEELFLAAGRMHPYLTAVHRPTVARWLLEVGDTAQADRLLTWHEGIPAGQGFAPRIRAANRAAEPVALYMRAKVAEATGRTRVARMHYRGFLERYDRPVKAHEPWVVEARAAYQRLSASPPFR